MDVWALEGSSWALLYPFTTGDLPCDLEVSNDHTWHIPVIPDSLYITLVTKLLLPPCWICWIQDAWTCLPKHLLWKKSSSPKATLPWHCNQGLLQQALYTQPRWQILPALLTAATGSWSRPALQGPRNFYDELGPWYEFTPWSSTDPVWHSVSEADRLACRYSRATNLDGKRKQSHDSGARGSSFPLWLLPKEIARGNFFSCIKSHWNLDPFCKNLSVPVCHHWPPPYPTKHTLEASRSRLLYKLLTITVLKEVVWICKVLNFILPNYQKSLLEYLAILQSSSHMENNWFKNTRFFQNMKISTLCCCNYFSPQGNKYILPTKQLKYL